MILIAGNARSGTSWLGKIFDSHPDVAYRHEPDSSVPCYEFPFLVEETEYSRYEAIAANYLSRLCDVRTIRSVGRRPRFRKSFHTPAAAWIDSSAVRTIQALARLPFVGSYLNRVNVRELRSKDSAVRNVVKTVISMGRVGLYAQVLETGKVVFILRHPCGVVASQLRGIKLGKLTHEMPFRTIAASRVGKEYQVSAERLELLAIEEQIAWIWLVMNEHALRDIEDRANSVVVTHEALCENPIGEAKRLFHFCDLPWSEQSEKFLSESARFEKAPSYFDVSRNPAKEPKKWMKELPDSTIEKVQGILVKSSILSKYW